MRRIVASAGVATAPLSGCGRAPNRSSTERGQDAASWAAPAREAKPGVASASTITARTYPAGCTRPPPGRGSATAPNIVSEIAAGAHTGGRDERG